MGFIRHKSKADSERFYSISDLEQLNISPNDVIQVFVDGNIKYVLKKNAKLYKKMIVNSSENFEKISDLNIFDENSIESSFSNNEIYDSHENALLDNSYEIKENDDYTINPNELKVQDKIVNPNFSQINNPNNFNVHMVKTDDILYKVYDLNYNFDKQNPYDGTLKNISFNIYPGDKIAIVSTDSLSDEILLNILSKKTKSDSGHIFYNINNNNDWADLNSVDIEDIYEDEKIVNANSYETNASDYFALVKNRFETVITLFNRVFKSIDNNIDNIVYGDLLYLLNMSKILDKKISLLTEIEKRKFTFMCDVLIGKRIIFFKNLTEDFNIREKINFYRYINNLFEKSNNVFIFSIQDTFEIKLFATKLLIIDDGYLKINKKISEIVKMYPSIDYLIYEIFDNANKEGRTFTKFL